MITARYRNGKLVPGAHGMVRQRPMMGCLASEGSCTSPGRLQHPGSPYPVQERLYMCHHRREVPAWAPACLLRCYKVRLSATTRVDTPHLGSAAASSEHIPWSIDRMSSQDFIPSAPVYGIHEIIWHKELRRTDRHRERTLLLTPTSLPSCQLKMRLWRDYPELQRDLSALRTACI